MTSEGIRQLRASVFSSVKRESQGDRKETRGSPGHVVEQRADGYKVSLGGDKGVLKSDCVLAAPFWKSTKTLGLML